MSEEPTNEAEEERAPDSEEAMSPSERRGDPRHFACFPAHLQTAQGVPRSALIRDLSVSGALLLTRAKLAIGDTVKLSLHVREGLAPFATTARVVREEKRTSEMVHPWTKAIAVQFDQPIFDLEDEARDLADRQAALRGSVAVTMGDPQRVPQPPPVAMGDLRRVPELPEPAAPVVSTMGETPNPPARPDPSR